MTELALFKITDAAAQESDVADVHESQEPDAQSEEEQEVPASSPIPATTRRRRIVPSLPDLESEEESQTGTPTQQDAHTPPLTTEVPMWRRSAHFHK